MEYNRISIHLFFQFLQVQYQYILFLIGLSILLFFQNYKKPLVLLSGECFPTLSQKDISNCDPGYIAPQIDYVFHCAGFTGGAEIIKQSPDRIIADNAIMNQNLWKLALIKKVQKLVFISSSAVYPEQHADEPGSSEADGFRGDPDPAFFGPGWMKRWGEKLSEYYHKSFGVDVLVVRPSNVYGPHACFDAKHSHVIPALIRRFAANEHPMVIWGSAAVVRDFIYISDFVEGVLSAFEKFAGFDVFNISSNQETTIGDIVNTLSKLTHYDGAISFDVSRPSTRMRQLVSNDKAGRMLGFVPRMSIRHGLANTLDWYRENTK